MPLPLAALAIPAAFSLAKGVSGAAGKSKTKKTLEGLKDPGVVSQGMTDVLASQAQRAQGPDAILKQQQQAMDAAQANQMASATSSISSPNQLMSVLTGQDQAMGRQKSMILAQAGQRKIGLQQQYESTKMAMEQEKQSRKVNQYDSAIAQGKADIQEYNKRMWDAGAEIGALGIKGAMQGVSPGGTNPPNQVSSLAPKKKTSSMPQQVDLKTNTDWWNPSATSWMK